MRMVMQNPSLFSGGIVTEPSQSKTRFRWRSSLAVLVSGALALGGLPAAATAASADSTAKMTYTTTSTSKDDAVSTGGRLSYELRVECSNMIPGDCAQPVISFPAPKNDDGSVVAHTPVVSSPAVKSQNYDEKTGLLTVALNDMKPGESQQLSISWAVDNFTVKPGEELKTDPTVVFKADGTDTQAAKVGDDPAPIVTKTSPQISVTKTLVSPKVVSGTGFDDQGNLPAVYDLSVCVPGNTEGMENLSHVTITDTVTDSKKRITADTIKVEDLSKQAGDTVTQPSVIQLDGQNAVQMKYDIDLDGQTLTRCGQSSEPVTRRVQVTYSNDILAPASQDDPNPTNDVTNTLDATAQTISGTMISGQSALKHAFARPGGGSYGQLIAVTWKRTNDEAGAGTDSNNTTVGKVPTTSTTKEWGWTMAGSWQGDSKVYPDYDKELRWVSDMDRLPCLAPDQNGNTEAKSPLGKKGNESLAYAWGGDTYQSPYNFGADGRLTPWGMPDKDADAPLCNNPSYRLDRIFFRNSTLQPESISNVAAVEITYLENGQHKSKIEYFDQGLSQQGTVNVGDSGSKGYAYLYMYGSTAAQGAPSFGLADDAIVTDFVVHYRNQPNNMGGNNYSLWGTSTSAFAQSGLKAQTNTESVIASNDPQKMTDASDPASAKGQNPVGNGKTSAGSEPRVQQFDDATVDMQISKSAQGDVSKLAIGDTVTWKIDASVNATIPEDRKIKPGITDVLPVGLDYVPGSTKWASVPAGVTAPGEPEIGQKTVNGQQRTTLSWKFDSDFPTQETASLTFDTKVSVAASAGAHSAEDAQYVALYDQNASISNGGNDNDKYDVNGDGQTSDRVAASTTTWTVQATSGATIQKQVKGTVGEDHGIDNQPSGQDWSSAAVSAASTDNSGTAVDYRLKVNNGGTTPLQNTVVYDVLPYAGDKAIGSTLAGQDRGSQFDVKFRELTGQLPAGVKVQYSTSNNPTRPELGVSGGDDNWSDQLPANPADVRALKYTIDELTPGQELNLDYRADIPQFQFGVPHPAQQTGSDTEYAWNNLAFRTSTSERDLLPAEAPKVSIRSVLGEIGDYAWYDANRDGIQDAGEKPVEGVKFQLLDGNGNEVKDVDGNPVTATTDSNGLYKFEVPVGDWKVKVVEGPEGYVTTKADQGGDNEKDSDVPGLNVPSETVKITTDHLVDHSLDAGFVKPAVSVGDYVWFDQNGDGIQNDGEKGIPGVKLTITDQDGNAVKDVNGKDVSEVTTDANGAYDFSLLPVLTDGKKYQVHVDNAQDALKAYQPTKKAVGDDRAKDSSTAQATTGEDGQPALDQNEQRDSSLDFGFVGSVSVGDYVWQDDNRDGLQTEGEPGIPGVLIELFVEGPDGTLIPATYPDGTPVAAQRTDDKGAYLFPNLPSLPSPAGKYVTKIKSDDEQTKSVLDKYLPTKPGAGSDREKDSSTGQASSIKDLSTPGAEDRSLDFGFMPKVKIGDYVWFDADKNGKQDDGEKGIPNVTLTLVGPDGKQVTDVNGNPVGPVKTNDDGYYEFANLPTLAPGQHYTVVLDKDGQPETLGKYSPTQPNAAGTDRADDSSTGSASSEGLNAPGDEDLTLDFGFVPTTPTVEIKKYDVNGNDADTAQDAAALPSGDTDLRFTITNTGDEELVNLKISDAITQGDATVTDLVCTFPDGTQGTSWAGPLKVGEKFDCTAKLSGVKSGDDHADAATVVGDGRWSGVPVTDVNEYHARTPKPSIDLEKTDTDGNDADTESDKVIVNADTRDLKFTVTNNGDEGLKDVKLSDSVIKGGAKVQNIVCTFPDGSTGTSWAGVFEVRASFECRGQITGLVAGDLHADSATVTGVGVITGQTVTDEDPFYAERQQSGLARTGLDGIGGIAGMILLLLGGGVVALARRNRSKSAN
ncbi:hypothetical protein F8O06_01075 [Pseudoclavibacter sp. CFCC 14310]|nr:hypothetical protein F8O06_01075 [Pseudoclavibacter sp. CFCC 14310]